MNRLRATLIRIGLMRESPTSAAEIARLRAEYRRLLHRPGEVMILPHEVRVEDLRG